jgi:uncharacterized protein YutE (UPF0331/DUF86 family)/predicted nucleotidyltransferase
VRNDPERSLRIYLEEKAPKGILSVYLYSERGDEGTARDSDLDVAVLVDPHLYPDRKARAQLRLDLAPDVAHALRDDHVDLVILNDASPTLGRKVVTGWPRVFCSDPGADHAFVRDVQLQAADTELFPTGGARPLFEVRPRPFLQQRLEDLRGLLDHLYQLQPRAESGHDLEADLSLYNDVRYTLLTVAQLVIDIAAELSVRRRLPFSDYSEAIRNLAVRPEVDSDLVEDLSLLPGFRNALLHPHIALDPAVVVEHLHDLKPVEELMVLVARSLAD